MKVRTKYVSYSPVLNNGTSPSLDFQKFSRWYSAYCGVDRTFWLGFTGSMMPTVSVRRNLRVITWRELGGCILKESADSFYIGKEAFNSLLAKYHRYPRIHAIIVTRARPMQAMTKGDEIKSKMKEPRKRLKNRVS